MRKLIPVFVSLSLFSFGCTEADNGNSDLPSEVSCSSATGDWIITAASCDGVSASMSDSITLAFNSSSSVTQSQGPAACTSIVEWDVLVGTDNSLSLTGNGPFSCSANGVDVASCSDPSNSCNSSVDFTGSMNNYDTCAISGSTMTLLRTVSSVNNPDGMSFCADGEAEEVTLTQSSGSSEAVLVISESDPYDYGNVGVGGSQSHTFTVTNTGGAAASSIAGGGLAPPFTFAGGAYPGTGGTCGATLASAASCTLVVSFNPVSAGAFSDTIDLSYNDGSAVQIASRQVQGTGSNGAILIISESDPYNYGQVGIFGSSNHVFTVTNAGGVNATAISGSTLAFPFEYSGGGSVYPGVLGTCTSVLAPGANCTIDVSFSPTSIGVFNGTIILNYNDGTAGQTASRDIRGEGI